ncbi:hypothetical protein EIP86_010762, partial [Pleurotus ostreatoroseus]
MSDISRYRSNSVHHAFSAPSSDEELLDDSLLNDAASLSQVPLTQASAAPPSAQTPSTPRALSSSSSIQSNLASPIHLPDETDPMRSTHIVSNTYLQSIGLFATSWGALVCANCRIAHNPKTMLQHLQRSPAHSSCSIVIKRPLYEQALVDCHISEELPSAPTTVQFALAGLPYASGYACPHCIAGSLTQRAVVRHIQRSHPTQRAGSEFPSCFLQHMNNGADKEYFQVLISDNDQQEQQDVLQATLNQINKDLSSSLYDPATSTDVRNYHPFIRKLGWYDVIKDKNAQELCKTVLPAADEYPRLHHAARDWLNSIDTLHNNVSKNVCKHLNTSKANDLNNQPFGPLSYDSSKIKYASTLESFLAMLLRSQESWITPFHEDLITTLDTLRTSLNTPDIPLEEPIDHVLRCLWHYEWCSSDENPIPDPTVRYIILKLLNKDGSFAELDNLTPMLAKFKHLIRAFFLRVLTTDSFSPRPSFEDIQDGIHEGTDMTFDTICDLQHQASSIVFQTQKPSNIYWMDSKDTMTMLYSGDTISLKDLQAMFADVQDRTQALLEKELLLNTGLHVDYTLLHENISNTSVGYCFLEDKRNPFYEHRTTFLERVVQHTELGPRFCYVTDHQVVWNQLELNKWLTTYSTFSLHLLLRLEMLSGGPGRGTELTGMLIRSSKGQSLRNLIALGPHLILLRTHSKTSTRNNNFRLIPHAIDTFTADILIQDLTLLRPFAEFAVRQCFPNDSEVLTRYQYNLFVNRQHLFDTTDLSTLMAEYTLKHLSTRLTVRSWRHVAIAYRRLLCSNHMPLYDVEDDTAAEDPIAAEQTGHTVSTERMKYAITPDSLAGCAEHILPLFIVASQSWQKAMHIVP